MGELSSFFKAFKHSYGRGDFSYKCQEVKYEDTPAMKKLILMTYLYFITKIIDLMDTVSYTLRLYTKPDWTN